MRIALFTLFAVLPAGLSIAAEVWLHSDEYSQLHVVMTTDAPAYEQEAAGEFISYWEKCTGYKPDILEVPGEGVNVYVGLHRLPAEVREQLDVASLEPDGVVIKTYDSLEGSGKSLVIAGAGDRGTRNAVYEFFERYIGVRWLSEGVIFIPRSPGQGSSESTKPWEREMPSALPAIDFRYRSPFTYRWTTTPNAKELRLTQYPDFGLFVHTIYYLLPPDEYFPKHPEYFSEIDGKRVAPVGLDWGRYLYDEDFREKHRGDMSQFCFSNPELPEVVAENLLKRIRENPKPLIWSVSQMDWDNYCQCAACKQLEEAEGTPMAPLLVFVNKVAEIVEHEFPDHYIETLAYTWSRRAPKTLKPRHNVIIRLCSIECDFGRPLDDPNAPNNVPFARDIREWSQIANQLYIWDYTVNFRHYFLPHPNLRVLQPNLRFFAQHNVRGVFEQGMSAPWVELGHLRPYLLARLLWNPDVDVPAIQDEFIDLFYQEAAPAMKKYVELIHNTLAESGVMMNTFDEGEWITQEFLAEARRLLDEGISAARSEEIKKRVAYEKLAVEYASLVAPCQKSSVEGDSFVFRYPESLTPTEYVELAKSFGVPNFSETKKLEELPKYVKARPGQLVSYPIKKIRNERYEMWVVPEWQGSAIRWRDNELDAELLSGYRARFGRPRTWQDWDSRQQPAAETYTVDALDDHTITLSAVTETGLQFRRTMSLPPGSDHLIVELEMKNPTEEPITTLVKQHPELYTQGDEQPEICGLTPDGWEPISKTPEGIWEKIGGAVIPAANYRALACYLPEKHLTIVCAFEPLPDAQLLWFVNVSPQAQHVNLELLPPPKPLAPGESVVLRGEFYATRQKLWE
ncbi:MAG TPA: DUF4838 domain-containing protein [Candidatus Hydrogenedentes bacterium]|nr:DUF4838 domain-containing protein [Candidatus Hydrogenedentota bacterium]HOL78254.1 DUF4838 domain-containing protein [Candidatus Hydrogenedentota bacterium]HPO86394.1 DUF4838 domain-containing protein [Candidatus Hydrogenedentota bacterium]